MSSAAPIVTIDGGAVSGAVVPGDPGVYVFRGLPYATPPAGDLRWRPPRPPAGWQGVRDATRFGPSCPQPANPALTGPTSEDCLVGDATFACPALQMDRWTSKWVPTFAYEFNDDNAPLRYPPALTGPPVATHKSEFPYLFDLPDAPLQDPLSPDQQALAASMRTAWANSV